VAGREKKGKQDGPAPTVEVWMRVGYGGSEDGQENRVVAPAKPAN